MKKKKQDVYGIYNIPRNLFTGVRNSISKVLIEELSKIESSTKISTEEFCRLAERLYQVTRTKKK
jgi:hypothetical protein